MIIHKEEHRVCDRCGTEVDGKNMSKFWRKWCNIHGLHAKDGVLNGVTNVDLCPKCREEFEDWMKNRKSIKPPKKRARVCLNCGQEILKRLKKDMD